MSKTLRKALRTGLALSLTAAMLSAVAAPARAQDGGAVAAGLLSGMAIGAIAGSALAAPPPPVYYAPAYPPPPRCWFQPQQVWNGYTYVVVRVRVCN